MKNVQESINWREIQNISICKLKTLFQTNKVRFFSFIKKLQKAEMEEEDLHIIGSPTLIKYIICFQFYERILFNNWVVDFKKLKQEKLKQTKFMQKNQSIKNILERNFKKIQKKKNELKFMKNILTIQR